MTELSKTVANQSQLLIGLFLDQWCKLKMSAEALSIKNINQNTAILILTKLACSKDADVIGDNTITLLKLLNKLNRN